MSIFSKISGFFSRKKQPHHIVSATRAEIEKSPEIVRSFLDEKTDGLVVKNLLSEKKCANILSKVKNLSSELKIETPFGAMHGKILVGAGDDMEQYFKLAELLNRELEAVLDLDIIDILNSLFDNIQFGSTELNGKKYVCGTLREFDPNKGGLHAHAEAEFITDLPEFEPFRNGTIRSSHLNYLLILQAPEEGGELVLYDLRWKDSPEQLKGKLEFRDHYRHREPTISEYEQQPVPLKTGDLLLFNGINIWHGVTEVRGSKSRKTFAGFIARKNGQDDYIVYN